MHFSFTSALTVALALVSSAAAARCPPSKSLSVRGTTTAALTAEQKSALDVHNKGRATKNLSPLVWDASLVASAQTCANKIAASGNFAHCQSAENLYAQIGGSSTPLVAGAQSWLNEASAYHGEKIPQGNFASYGHYTQVMWKSTTNVGMAQAKGSNGWTYVVAHYNPGGNMVGQTPY